VWRALAVRPLGRGECALHLWRARASLSVTALEGTAVDSMAHSLWLFAVPYATASALPGPAQGVMVAEVLSRGGRAAGPFVVGMVAGNAIWLCASLFALDTIASQLGAAVVVIKWVGAAFCAYMAWRIWHAPATAFGAARAERRRDDVFGGLVLTLGNPKAFVFFGAILPQAVDVASLSLAQCLTVLAIGVGIDAGVQTAYLVTASRARHAFQSHARLKLANRAAALVIGCVALLIVLRS
jgi:threonine/homoserine/homoserine lactone efflux protein